MNVDTLKPIESSKPNIESPIPINDKMTVDTLKLNESSQPNIAITPTPTDMMNDETTKPFKSSKPNMAILPSEGGWPTPTLTPTNLMNGDTSERSESFTAAGPPSSDYALSERSGTVIKKLWSIAELLQDKLKTKGGFDQEEFKTLFAKAGLKSSSIDLMKLNVKFNEFDTNKNGKIEEFEIKSANPDWIEDPQINTIEEVLKGW